ncbi:MEDS domain-containing protein [Candidatus Borrarchaeum sp.]|uniref:MEDS domain-containing protein n=1 Tax=Candidatus Borrarchaeum sp. TaxID=2846742 RepID=UPI00257E784B|nr:MEDS domain-containing protein [Candidatus Borrarchaeum sp.]
MKIDKFPLYDTLRQKIQLGVHICYIYETKEQQFALVIPFIKEGLECNHKCIYIIDESGVEEIQTQLKNVSVDVDLVIEKGQLVFTTSEDTYTKEDAFDPDVMIALIKAHLDTALADGYDALRVTGEMTWALKSRENIELLVEYEAKLNYFFPGNRVLAICQYDENKFTEGILVGILQTHPLAIYGDKIFGDRYYVQPDVMLRALGRNDLKYFDNS